MAGGLLGTAGGFLWGDRVSSGGVILVNCLTVIALDLGPRAPCDEWELIVGSELGAYWLVGTTGDVA